MATQKFISWNVNGIRASVTKGFYDVVKDLNADIFCVQETKATREIVQDLAKEMKDYHCYANEAEKKGYSGTAVFSKEKAISERYEFGIKEHDNEGRLTAVEYEKYWFINVYVANSGSGMKRLDYRKTWDAAFLDFIQECKKSKLVIVTGDFNVAHEAIDLARPKPNYNKTSGYTQVEIDGFDNFLGAGLVDTFRNMHPEKVLYSFWNQRFNARKTNAGWRLDYFLVNEEHSKNVKVADVLTDIMGSDHCPIELTIEV